MKTLIIVAHPNLGGSKFNHYWINELKKLPELYTVHDLHAEYPDGEFDINREQALLVSHDTIIFQFPIYWFNCPPILKKWLDDVLTYGWAYGSSSGYKLQGKRITVAVSAGIDQQDYSQNGRYKYTLDELLRPFEVTVNYIKGTWMPFFAHYGIEAIPEDEIKLKAELEKSFFAYRTFLCETNK
ncbi:NAD(P)H-dependent oxidoreductase [Providencia rettgeri]|uniref:NAD(P)H-dependent oxidoreductase n=1 Tax=Providencia rettgeri TaxID=587 RepID=UPI0034E0A217